MNADLFELKDDRPNVGQLFLERRSWCDEGPCGDAAACESQLLRQADTLHFAGWTFGQLRDDEHLAWNFEIGDAAHGELTYLSWRCGTVGLQHDRRGDVLSQGDVRDGEGH